MLLISLLYLIQDPDAEIGQRIEMSEIDAMKVNLMYCPERLGHTL